LRLPCHHYQAEYVFGQNNRQEIANCAGLTWVNFIDHQLLKKIWDNSFTGLNVNESGDLMWFAIEVPSDSCSPKIRAETKLEDIDHFLMAFGE